MLSQFLGGGIALLSIVFALVVPSLRRKNKDLKRSLFRKDAEIKFTQNNEKIKRDVDSLSDNELLKRLRESKT